MGTINEYRVIGRPSKKGRVIVSKASLYVEDLYLCAHQQEPVAGTVERQEQQHA